MEEKKASRSDVVIQVTLHFYLKKKTSLIAFLEHTFQQIIKSKNNV